MRRQIWVIEQLNGKAWEPCCAMVDGFINKPDALDSLERWRRGNKTVGGLIGFHQYRIRAYRPRAK